MDSSDKRFPSYAELTQSSAWAAATQPMVAAALGDARDAADLSHGSRYTEGALLGKGGMGKVMLAKDARIGRDVAVKVLHAEHELSPEDRARFLREAQVQGQLEHPSIVPVYDIDRRADGTTFFTMRRVLGRTLHAILAEARAGASKHTQRELLGAFATVCLAIDYAHSRGVIHRDLKPANIMLGDFGEVYVLDWGLARVIDGTISQGHRQRLSMPGDFLGTPLYMAPEQMVEPDVSSAADVFSLGAILFEILTFERLRDAEEVFAPIDARASVRAPKRNVPPELETICVRATAADPADRFSSARALHDALARYLEGDRELEQRRQLASGHVKQARAALTRSETASEPEKERGTAMRELVRALALDPSDGEQVAMLAQMMATPPRELPVEVKEQLRAETRALVQNGARHSATAMLSWFLFIPIVLAMGLRNTWELVAIAVLAGGSAMTSLAGARVKAMPVWMQYLTIALMMFAAMGLSRMFGPLVLVPTIIATYAIVLQAHPLGHVRVAGAAIAAVAMTLPMLLELAGVLPQHYTFAGGEWTIAPQLFDLGRGGTVAFLLLADLGSIIVPCLFIAKLRQELSDAQQRQLVQAWHFRRLGAELVEAR